MEKTLVGFGRRDDIVAIAVFGVLLCIARASIAASVGKEFLESKPTEVPSSDENICLTKGCRDTADTYLKNMDLSVHPCDNFYKFACGGFLNSTIIPGDKDSVSSISLMRDELSNQLKTSIELPIEPNEPKPFRLVKNFYKACMNEDEVEEEGLKTLGNILKKLGGWPVISGDQWNDRNFDWKSSIYKVQDAGYNINYLINIALYVDLKNTSRASIYIDRPTYGLDDAYLAKGFDDKFVQEYYNYMVDIAVILGADEDRAKIELKESLLFELELFNISRLEEERMKDINLYYHPMTFAELKKNYPSFPWSEYFVKLLPPNDIVAEDEIIIVSDPNYIANMVNIMEATSKRIQANYVLWRVVVDSVVYLNRDIRGRELASQTVFKGVTEREPRWKECVDAVSNRLTLGVGALYVKSYFSEEAKINAVETIMGIKKQLAETLRKVEWMDNHTRNRALEKLAAMSSVVAYFDELLNVDLLEKHYENLELSGGNYLESFINCSLFTSHFLFSILHEPVKKNDWRDGNPAIVNAMYLPTENRIEIPAGILQGVFFGHDRPKYTNYGGIGFVIGHEITHGFDKIGSQFDKNGTLADWWAASTKESFVKQAECLIQQYGNYTADDIGLKMNGDKTINENIADNGGAKLTYLAYENWASRNLPEKQLPGLNYTSTQMLWISTANSWCTKFTKEVLTHMVKTDTHSPAEFRIVGSLSNMPQFSKDFDCPLGSKMNPIDKCSVW